MNLENVSPEVLKLALRGVVRSCLKDAHPGTVRKSFAASVTKSAGGVYRFVLSDGNVDRDGDTIDPAGWDLTNYKRNPIVLWAHQATLPPIGRSKSITLEHGPAGIGVKALVATVEFAPTPFAQEIRELVDSGFISGASVGFRPLEGRPNRDTGGMAYTKCELHEWSVVPVPANPGALARKALGARGLESVDPRVLREVIRELVRAEVR